MNAIGEKKLFKFVSRRLWQYFSDYLSVVAQTEDFRADNIPNKQALKEAIESDLEDKNFTEDEIKRVWSVYDNDLIGESIYDIISINLGCKLLSYLLQLENPNMNQKELIEVLHKNNLDYSSEEGMAVYTAYHKYQFM